MDTEFGPVPVDRADGQSAAGLGHNARRAALSIELRFFNSLTRYGGQKGPLHRLEVAAGTTVGDLMARFRVPAHEIFLVLRNGRDISPGLYEGGNVNAEAVVDDGDVIAFSGPVPYSYGYGAPIV